MADFIQNQINQSNNDIPQNKNDVGQDSFQKVVLENLNLIKDYLLGINKSETKSNKNEEQEKNKKEQDRIKAEQRHQQLVSALRSFSGDLQSTVSSLTNTGINKISDLLGAGGKIGMLAQAAIEAVRVGVKISFMIDRMQTQQNIQYLKSHSLNNIYNSNFVDNVNDFYLKSLSRGVDYGMKPEEVDAANQELNSTMNMRKLEDWQQLRTQQDFYRIANKGARAVNPEFAELYKTMLGQGGLSSQSAYANLNAFNRSFEFSSLGTERSLQMSKQLYEANRRYHQSINESAGYIHKFNRELQAGTSTLSDITAIKTTLKTKNSGDLAGLGQMIVNMGHGTQAMINASGNPFAMAEILRKGDRQTINSLQDTMDSIAEGAGFGKGAKGRSEYLRNLWGSFGFSFNEDILNKLTKGQRVSAYDLGIKIKEGETPEQAKEREANEFARLLQNIDEKTIAAGDTYEAQMLKGMRTITSWIGEQQNDLTTGKAINPITNPKGYFDEFKKRYKENGLAETAAQAILGDKLYNTILKYAYEKGE